MEKAKILVLNDSGKKVDEIKVMFNPNEYSIESRNKLSSKDMGGTYNEVIQFAGSEADTFNLELFFDTYSNRNEKDKEYISVKKYTQRIKNLMKANSKNSAPPICLFAWGNLFFKGYIESINERFTMFSDKGIPLRAHLNVTFKAARDVEKSTDSASTEAIDDNKEIVLKDGEQLCNIANKTYGNSSNWRPIADANNIDNPRKINSGKKLKLP